MLAVYQENGIERGTALLAGWFEKLAARGLIRIKEPRATAGLLLAMTIAEPLRQMALGLAQPLPQARSRIASRLAWRCFPARAGCSRSCRTSAGVTLARGCPFSCAPAARGLCQSASTALPWKVAV
ncbi:TetR/AcrR family transcriptional regulator C-terminal domain-containing protein [Achromobacter insuavis]